jgi:hypothetical protein
MIVDAVIIGVFAMAASVVLVIGAKWLGSAVVSRPAGTRAGELGDPRDDLVDAPADARAEEADDA